MQIGGTTRNKSLLEGSRHLRLSGLSRLFMILKPLAQGGNYWNTLGCPLQGRFARQYSRGVTCLLFNGSGTLNSKRSNQRDKLIIRVKCVELKHFLAALLNVQLFLCVLWFHFQGFYSQDQLKGVHG